MAKLPDLQTRSEDTSWVDAAETVDQNSVEQIGREYPYIQWVNGKKQYKPVGGVMYTGGWFLPADNAPEGGVDPATGEPLELPGWQRGELMHASGNSTEGYFSRDISVAILHMRQCWVVSYGDKTTAFPWNQYDQAREMAQARDGSVSSKTHVLVAVSGLEGAAQDAESTTPPDLYFLTMSGSIGQRFVRSRKNEGVLGAFDRLVIRPANMLNLKRGIRSRWPLRAFWLTVGPERSSTGKSAGEPIFTTVGSGTASSQVTLPTALGLVERPLAEDLRERFVGRELLQQLNQLWEETRDWARAWDQIETEAAPTAERAAEAADFGGQDDFGQDAPDEDGLPF